MNEYGASECLTIAFACSEQWLHVNDDWVIVEAVDADHHPVRAGEPSDTALITNLANRVQPVIRYDIGDSIVVHPGACACGNPMTAIRVEGRRDDVVVLPGDGHHVRVPPMALTTIVEEATDVHRFQIVQRGDDSLIVRLGVDSEVQRRHKFAAAAKALRRFLESQGVRSVQLVSDAAPPQPDARSGKLRQVIVERGARDAAASIERQIGAFG
jgi:phenylacetate-coenzyme A ligase PaaK-like adenylate-forming protein